MTRARTHPLFVTGRARCRASREGYILLETVVATGLLIVGLAVIGAQVQSADTSVREMDRQTRAMMLAEQQLAELDLGLIQLDSLNEVEEGDYGPRHPDWAWLMTTKPTVVEGLFRLRVDVYYLPRQEDYRQNNFDYDKGQVKFTAYTFRATPRPIDFAVDYGLNDEEFNDLSKKFTDLGIPIDPSNFSPGADLLDLPFEDLVKLLPPIMEAMGLDFDQLAAVLPKDVLDQLRQAGVFGDEADNGDGTPSNERNGAQSDNGGGAQPNNSNRGQPDNGGRRGNDRNNGNNDGGTP